MQQHRQHAEHPLGEHVARIRGIDFSVDCERQPPQQPADAHRGCRPFLVVLEASGPQHRIDLSRVVSMDVRRVLVSAARKQIAIPPGAGDEGRTQSRGDNDGTGKLRPAARPLRCERNGRYYGRPEHANAARSHQRSLQPEAGNEQEPGAERAGHRTNRIGHVDARGVTAGRCRSGR